MCLLTGILCCRISAAQLSWHRQIVKVIARQDALSRSRSESLLPEFIHLHLVTCNIGSCTVKVLVAVECKLGMEIRKVATKR